MTSSSRDKTARRLVPFHDPNAGYRRWRTKDAQRWARLYQSGKPITRIAAEEDADQSTVSQWLHKLGLDIKQGSHKVKQPPLRYSKEFIGLINEGPEKVLQLVKERVWGVMATENGIKQLNDLYEFFQLHHQGVGVKECARLVEVHRSTIAEWREATDQPYLAKIANSILNVASLEQGWKLVPLHISSGANELREWVSIPNRIGGYEDISKLVGQLKPLDETYRRARLFGIPERRTDRMRPELFSYALGMVLGDAGKEGGQQQRLSSMNIDLHLTKKEPTNERLGELVCMCTNSLGIQMERRKDKPPTGATKTSQQPTPAYRWASERSPLIAWMFSVGLGLNWDETTSNSQVRMDWVFNTPFDFRKRFVQALADSDGTVKPYTVVITSTPNAEFLTKLFHSLGLESARTKYENGKPLRTAINAREAAKLPVFSEFAKGYRYQKLQQYA